MINHFPVFIGITGKRHLSAGSASSEIAERKVRNALGEVFNYIEKMLPDAPKVLLTGAAAGADLIAAQEVLRSNGAQRRRNWLVLAVLPFELALFEQDFEPDEWTMFKEVPRRCAYTQLDSTAIANGRRVLSPVATSRSSRQHDRR
jgi:hypothetical protein